MEGGKKKSLFLRVEEPLRLIILAYVDEPDGLGPLSSGSSLP